MDNLAHRLREAVSQFHTPFADDVRTAVDQLIELERVSESRLSIIAALTRRLEEREAELRQYHIASRALDKLYAPMGNDNSVEGS